MMNRVLTVPASRLRQHLSRPASKTVVSPDQVNSETLWRYQILDPNGEVVTRWNHFFLVMCLVSLFIDPLYFYLPYVGGDTCMTTDNAAAIAINTWRSLADVFFVLHIIMKFRTAFIAPSSKVFGRGELVMDKRQIARRYLRSDFVIDVAASLPLPQAMRNLQLVIFESCTVCGSEFNLGTSSVLQIVNELIIPATKRNNKDHANNTLSLIVLIQYIPRLFVIFPLNQRIIKSTGFVAKTAWAGAAYNLLLYMLASHVSIFHMLYIVLGASWYLMSIGRQHSCWQQGCKEEMASKVCISFLDCNSVDQPERKKWLQSTSLRTLCDASNETSPFKFGMFADAFTSEVASSKFFENSYGQNLETSIYIGETLFCSTICIGGLILFAQLIGNMQTYLQSMTVRLEEWRIKKRDTEEWMRHRQLPPDLQDRVRRLVSSLSTQGTYIVREDDPVSEMLFIIRGQLESSTTDGGRSGFFNSITLRPGDFCGEELLTWALLPNPTNYPSSTRSVRTLTEVEGFALQAEDLKFVANQFKYLHSKKLQHAFRYYSHQWRTWGACFLQAAWRKYKRRKLAKELALQENAYYLQESDGDVGATILASRFAASTRKGIGHRKVASVDSTTSLKMPQLFKPDEPNF
ncbi:Cyclic nucleotide-binding domain-containing protein [Cynara cardunculus var. scolymus]|uniref:Cyclic nucleotide-binding domain-containing protein n=1 Tax=Cynara cardunculus var. scolymus TaxID=59895 RepID=A0A103XL49_CYNCS|nr:Cyclic nucleotide-binding domain-containing protein [Cynara cardunculus var. scolymus]